MNDVRRENPVILRPRGTALSRKVSGWERRRVGTYLLGVRDLAFPDKRMIKPRLRRFVRKQHEVVHQELTPWGGTVHIVIPCYNHGPFLARAIESCASQDYEGSIEISVVDDCSSDDSLDIALEEVNKLSDRFERFRVCQNDRNRGQVFSLNEAISLSDTAVVLNLDADDFLFSDSVRILVDLLRESKSEMVGGPCVTFVDGTSEPCEQELEPRSRKFVTYGPDQAWNFASLNDINMTQSGCMFTRFAWRFVGGFLPKQHRICAYHDRDFQMRVCGLMPVSVFCDDPVAAWRLGSTRSTSLR